MIRGTVSWEIELQHKAKLITPSSEIFTAPRPTCALFAAKHIPKPKYIWLFSSTLCHLGYIRIVFRVTILHTISYSLHYFSRFSFSIPYKCHLFSTFSFLSFKEWDGIVERETSMENILVSFLPLGIVSFKIRITSYICHCWKYTINIWQIYAFNK